VVDSQLVWVAVMPSKDTADAVEKPLPTTRIGTPPEVGPEAGVSDSSVICLGVQAISPQHKQAESQRIGIPFSFSQRQQSGKAQHCQAPKECGTSAEGIWKECGRNLEGVRKECGRNAKGMWQRLLLEVL
jgi:hypothetical protein